MTLDKSKISKTQFMFSVACFIQSSSLLTSFFTSITKQDSWIAVILGSIVSIPILLIYSYIMKTFPNKNLIEINDIVFGPIIGKVFSITYIGFFITISSINTKDLGEFVQKTILENTPSVIIVGLLLLLCSWSVRNGIEIVTRYSLLFTFIATIIVVSTIFLTIDQMEMDNFLPILQEPTMTYVQATHIILAIPFGEIVVFLMINPNLDIEPKKRMSYLFYGFLLGGITLLLVVFRDIAVLSKTIEIFLLPSYETLRLISIHSTISRVEALFAISLIILMFFKISILYYISVLGIAHIFKMKSYKTLVLSVGVIIMIYSYTVYPSIIAHMESGSRTAPFGWIVVEAILPLITLIVAKIRKLPKEKKGMIS